MKCSFWRRSIFLTLVFLLLTAGWLPDALAHKTGVHKMLTEKSAEISGVSFHEFDVTNIRQGSYDEDKKGFFRYMHHHYNPYTGSAGKTPGAKTAVWAARDRWEKMRMAFLYPGTRWLGDVSLTDDAEDRGSMHTLGRVMHLLQDMAAPPHVHPPDGHGWVFHPGPGTPVVGYYSDFEEKWSSDSSAYANWQFPSASGGPLTPGDTANWLDLSEIPKSRLDDRSTGQMLDQLKNIRGNQVEDYMNALAWISYYHSSFYGRIQKNEEFPAPFVSGDLPENILRKMYWDENKRVSFTSGSFWNAYNEYWAIDGVGYYGKRLEFFPEDWWPCPGPYEPAGSGKTAYEGFDPGIAGRFYIYLHYYEYDTYWVPMRVGAVIVPVPVGVFYQGTPPDKWPDGSANSAGISLAQYYGEALLPLAIRFGAALMEEVFPAPGSLSYPPVNSSGRFTVQWGAVPATDAGSPTGYRLERSDDGGASWSTVYKGPGREYLETVDTPGNYRYRVSAEWFGDHPLEGYELYGPVREDDRDCRVTFPTLRVRSSRASEVDINSPTGHSGTTSYTVTAAAGTTVTLEAPEEVIEYWGEAPRYIYRFSHWTIGEATGTDRTTSFTMGEEYMLATAHYVVYEDFQLDLDDDPVVELEPRFLLHTLTVNAFDDSKKEIEVSISSETGHGGTTPYTASLINHGTDVHLEAPEYLGSGDSRMRFSHWSEGVESTDWSIFFTMNTARTVRANYVKAPALIPIQPIYPELELIEPELKLIDPELEQEPIDPEFELFNPELDPVISYFID